MKNYLFGLFLSLLLFSCNNNDKKKTGAGDIINPSRPATGAHKSVGSLSFKLNGKLFEADPAHAKAWMTTQSPLAMLMAKNDKGLSVSMQLYNIQGEGNYKIDGDRKGTLNFTINEKTYWTRSVMGDDYLNVVITSTKSQATVILLSGTFEGVLEDKDKNKVLITEGKFITESL